MSERPHWFNPYDRLAPYYDWMARVMLAPFGGETALRRGVIGELEVAPGQRVLELGCGTGSMTRELLRAGAEVVAYDLSEPMIERARARAPDARYVLGDILEAPADASYDRVLLAFVLHEMGPDVRARALDVARRALAPEGLLGVFDFAGGAPLLIDKAFRAYLRAAEPEMAWELLEDGVAPELESAGLDVVRRRHFALGTTEMLVCRVRGRS
jgi:ubiquinone/menaquinone biosynthesis C-methylase UbiE